MRTEDMLFVETGYKILYEEEGFLVVDKPAPLPVHAVGRFKEKNLLSLMTKDLRPDGHKFYIVNRLDSETSGLILIANSSFMAGQLGKLFERREVEKEYQAVVFGTPEIQRGTIEIPLGTIEEFSNRRRIPDPNGETVRTDYEVLNSSGDYSLLKIIPHTGRTHQIRVHAQHAGHPIAGDDKYLHREQAVYFEERGLKRLFLHAASLELQDLDGNSRLFEAPLPPELSTFLSRL